MKTLKQYLKDEGCTKEQINNIITPTLERDVTECTDDVWKRIFKDISWDVYNDN